MQLETKKHRYDFLEGLAPKLKGRLEQNYPLAKKTWFQAGGAADIYLRPEDPNDLKLFLSHIPQDIPITVIGASSNIIIRDGGIEGAVIQLGKGFMTFEILDNHCIKIGAGNLDSRVALECAKHDIAGLEFLIGIPGSIGGGVKMNAGAYGTEFKDVLQSIDIIDTKTAKLHTITPHDIDMGYRYTTLADHVIVTGCVLHGHKGDKNTITEKMNAIKKARQESQPLKEKTGGSTFANPSSKDLETLPKDMDKAWKLIDAVGGRGFTVGDAMMSEKHCNFMINRGQASAKDLEDLGETLRARVREKFNYELRWEIKRIGRTS